MVRHTPYLTLLPPGNQEGFRGNGTESWGELPREHGEVVESEISSELSPRDRCMPQVCVRQQTNCMACVEGLNGVREGWEWWDQGGRRFSRMTAERCCITLSPLEYAGRAEYRSS